MQNAVYANLGRRAFETGTVWVASLKFISLKTA